MRIGWVSVSPWAKTGYGRVTREIVARLATRHEVICIGHEGDVIVWGGKKEIPLGGTNITTLAITNPLVDAGNAAAMTKDYASRYKLDVIIALWDVWTLPFLRSIEKPYITYIPVDAPVNSKWAGYMRGPKTVVLMSKFGYREVGKFLAPGMLEYIPHGVDTNVFRPLNRPKAELRKKIASVRPIPEDAFLFVNTSANYGARKHLPLMLRTFKRFLDKHPDAFLYLHTNAANESPGGYDLPQFCDMLGITGRVGWPPFNTIIEPIEDSAFCELYNAADAYVSDSVGEGFGMPVLESMACGLPSIVPYNSSMPELIYDPLHNGRSTGLIFNNVPEDEYVDYPLYVPTLQYFPVPDQNSLLEQMAWMYDYPALRKSLGMNGRAHALSYDWDEKVMPKWFKLLEDLEVDLKVYEEVKESFKPE